MAITTSLWHFVVSKHKSTWSCYFSSRIETDPFHLCCFHHNDANSIRITFYVYRDPYYQHALNSVPAGISNHTLSKLWVKIISPGGSLKNKIRSWKSPGKVQEFHHPKGVGTLITISCEFRLSTPGGSACNFENANFCLVSLIGIFRSYECYRTSLMIRQHWFR